MRINLNTMVTAALTAGGAAALTAHYAGTTLPSTFAEGHTIRMPLWEVLEIFGPTTFMGMPDTHFKDNVIDLAVERVYQD